DVVARSEGTTVRSSHARRIADGVQRTPRDHSANPSLEWTNSAGPIVGERFVLTLILTALSLTLAVAFVLRRAGQRKVARIMSLPEPEQKVGEGTPEEGPGRAGLAVRIREAAPRPRGGLRRSRGHLRALPPVEGERRSDGERDGRARHAGDGDGGSRRRLAA